MEAHRQTVDSIRTVLIIRLGFINMELQICFASQGQERRKGQVRKSASEIEWGVLRQKREFYCTEYRSRRRLLPHQLLQMNGIQRTL